MYVSPKQYLIGCLDTAADNSLKRSQIKFTRFWPIYKYILMTKLVFIHLSATEACDFYMYDKYFEFEMDHA